MAEGKKAETKKATTKTKSKTKAKPKAKAEKVEKVEEVIASAKEIVEEKAETRRVAKKAIKPTDEVEVINFTSGNLFYRSPKSGRPYDFAEFGSADFITVDELKTMLSANPKFLREPWLLILDSDVVGYLGLDDLYGKIKMPRQIDSLFKMPVSELRPILASLPVGMRPLVVGRAVEKVRSGELDSRSVINLLEKTFDIELV